MPVFFVCFSVADSFWIDEADIERKVKPNLKGYSSKECRDEIYFKQVRPLSKEFQTGMRHKQPKSKTDDSDQF